MRFFTLTAMVAIAFASLISGCGQPAKKSRTAQERERTKQHAVPPAAKTPRDRAEQLSIEPRGGSANVPAVAELQSKLDAVSKQSAEAQKAAEDLRKSLEEERSRHAAAEKDLEDARARLGQLQGEKEKSEGAAHQPARDEDTMRKLFDVAHHLYDQNDYESARRLLEGLAELGYENGPVFYSLGQCCQELGDLDAALSNYGKAFDAFQHAEPKPPPYVHTLNNLGVVLRCLRRYSEAEEAYRKAIKAAPTYASAYYNLGVLYEDYLKDKPKALQTFEKYIDLRGERLQEAQERVKRLKGDQAPPK